MNKAINKSLVVLAISASAFTFSSCQIKLEEAYVANVAISNQSKRNVIISVEATKSEFTKHQCQPEREALAIEIPGQDSVPAARTGEVGVRLHCRMPPTRLAKIYQRTDFKIATAIVENQFVKDLGSQELSQFKNLLVGKTLKIKNVDGSYTQDIEVVEYHTVVHQESQSHFPWIDLGDATGKNTEKGLKRTGRIGQAWVMDLGNGTSLLQVVLGEKKLEIASEETLTISLTDLSAATVGGSPAAVHHALKIADDAGIVVSPVPFDSLNTLKLFCDEDGCSQKN